MHILSDVVSTMLEWMKDLGYFGILFGMMVEVIPSEVVLSYAGYLVSANEISFVGAVIFGTVGAVLQNWILYAIGRFGGRPFLEKYGKFLKLKKKHIDIAEGWFNKYGAGIVFTARFVPVMRQVISVPAGMARMSFGLFTLLTALASLPWSLLFVYLGWKLGDQWETIDEEAGKYVQEAILIALGLLVVYVVYKIVRSRRKSA
ncbi:DedA family protein [Paenibacillus xylaniclasticus]|uniref:DedA family protein n=1 Tax=Paenibacillus xylaniclasticus TaxID=588083 RepID=UPI000FDAABE4|nr:MULTISPECIES: DedA family protein [Paenibacillus]GFN33056.1 membrane protein [Paenibacillus curdlanolyticus]